ncbi:MAG: DUF4127 family protein [Spirochaetaceae bacterium]|jgi:hypothetical protein|nr:DUF4127 family protein [Spirochaetaceae bacterium]
MKTILYIPLDERPCNRILPVRQFSPVNISEITILTPPLEFLSRKKKEAPYELLWKWLRENLKSCYQAVISIDMLIYGGLLPSRIHHLDELELNRRFTRLEILLKNITIPVSVFDLIMRTPQYNSSDEEPDYWENWGKRIYKRSTYVHKKKLHILNDNEVHEFRILENEIPEEFILDYERRRKLNLNITGRIIELYNKGIIDHLIIPQDDSSEFGYTATDRELIRNIEPLLISYPGADEVGCTLLCRSALTIAKEPAKKKVFILYDDKDNRRRKPNYEGMSLEESLMLQIQSCGAEAVIDQKDADLILAVQTVDKEQKEAWEQHTRLRDIEILKFFIHSISTFLESGKSVALADVRYSNGGDFTLAQTLIEQNTFFHLTAYGAWNTSGNTIGSVLSRGLIEINWPHEETRLKNFKNHFIDDLLYQGIVRKKLNDSILSEMGINYFNLMDKSDAVSSIAKELLILEIKNLVPHQIFSNENLESLKVAFPWNRLFEIEIQL